MYLPPHFAETRRDVLQAAMEANPLATLVTQSPRGVEADHLPMLVRGEGASMVIAGHVARANPVWKTHPQAAEVLAIFHGPQAYVSPSAYPAKADHGRVVPTWNYLVVHARGRLRIVDEVAWKRALLEALTARHEAGMPAPWQVGDAPADYVDTMINAVVGIEIDVVELVGKWKLSQNQTTENRAGVANQLAARDDAESRELAARMRVRDYFVDKRKP